MYHTSVSYGVGGKKISKWTIMHRSLQQSIEYANQRSYLDDLFHVYPTIPDGIRELKDKLWANVQDSFNRRDNIALVKALLKMDLFPIKDSYIAYMRKDKTSIERNPQTVNRICGRLYEMGLTEVFKNCTLPKETNRQMGPRFREWVAAGTLGIMPVDMDTFLSTNDNAILNASDAESMVFAKEHLGYEREKGLDLVARFNGKYVIGEAKFLTDNGGHQNAQFNDAINTVQAEGVDAVKVAILDGVLYIPGRAKMYRSITTTYSQYNIMSALVLCEFLYSL